MIKLNVGCGTDLRNGYVNIDARPEVKPDIVVTFPCLLVPLIDDKVDYIVCRDLLEHLFRWEAISMLAEFYNLLESNGKLEIRVPDTHNIINSSLTTDEKISLMYGGQDRSAGSGVPRDNPQYFCHKYGWTLRSLTRELERLEFKILESSQCFPNFEVICVK